MTTRLPYRGCEWLLGQFTPHTLYKSWLEVEKEVATAQCVAGIIPEDAAIAINNLDHVSADEIAQEEEITHHDLNSFVRVAARHIAPPGDRYFHYGLTSSDVVDTAQALRLFRIVQHWRMVNVPSRRFQMFLARAGEEIAYGKLSGPVGGHSRKIPPRVEDEALLNLGLQTEKVATQVVSRDHYAAFVIALAGAASILGETHTSAILVALENMALWHERDISHSSAERIYLQDLCVRMDEVIHSYV